MIIYCNNFIPSLISLQDKSVSELSEIFSEVSDVIETATDMTDPLKARSHVTQALEALGERLRIPASRFRKSADGEKKRHHVFSMSIMFQFSFNKSWNFVFILSAFFSIFTEMLQTLPLPTAKCYMFHWEKDNFGKIITIQAYFLLLFFMEFKPDITNFSQRKSCLSMVLFLNAKTDF